MEVLIEAFESLTDIGSMVVIVQNIGSLSTTYEV